eukprot:Hpha_TRINITY_DN33465_c0_g1::TRINITY_DN33465_c0_g1_i1::g.849::m.849
MRTRNVELTLIGGVRPGNGCRRELRRLPHAGDIRTSVRGREVLGEAARLLCVPLQLDSMRLVAEELLEHVLEAVGLGGRKIIVLARVICDVEKARAGGRTAGVLRGTAAHHREIVLAERLPRREVPFRRTSLETAGQELPVTDAQRTVSLRPRLSDVDQLSARRYLVRRERVPHVDPVAREEGRLLPEVRAERRLLLGVGRAVEPAEGEGGEGEVPVGDVREAAVDVAGFLEAKTLHERHAAHPTLMHARLPPPQRHVRRHVIILSVGGAAIVGVENEERVARIHPRRGERGRDVTHPVVQARHHRGYRAAACVVNMRETIDPALRGLQRAMHRLVCQVEVQRRVRVVRGVLFDDPDCSLRE